MKRIDVRATKEITEPQALQHELKDRTQLSHGSAFTAVDEALRQLQVIHCSLTPAGMSPAAL
jgi:hypothetical protein